MIALRVIGIVFAAALLLSLQGGKPPAAARSALPHRVHPDLSRQLVNADGAELLICSPDGPTSGMCWFAITEGAGP